MEFYIFVFDRHESCMFFLWLRYFVQISFQDFLVWLKVLSLILDLHSGLILDLFNLPLTNLFCLQGS